MTAKQRRSLESYIRATADVMGLKDWGFHLADAPADDGSVAQCESIYGQKFANLWVSVDFWLRDPGLQRHVIVHELVHCHLAVTTHMVAGVFLKEKLGDPVYEVFEAGYEQAHEYAVDALATAIEANVPLPELP